MTNNGKRYNQGFRGDILRQILEEKRSISGIVKDFGVTAKRYETKVPSRPNQVWDSRTGS